MNLENLETKEPLIKDFFTWLFDDDRIINKNVTLETELDLALAPYYMDANIYYPKQIADFFDTKAMKRLGRISQLDLVIDEFPNVYHNRLEHSKGVYYRKLEEMLHNFQNTEWKKSIENNNMKLYLLAELIKMAGHDIGHFPLSHAFEKSIFSCHGPHEIVGQRIMLEDLEIQTVLKSISPDLPNTLQNLYEKPILNFQAHDESSYDVDRFDYVLRDNLYAGTPVFIPYSHYETIPVVLSDSGFPKINDDKSIITSNESSSTIDVYDYPALHNIEHLLELREDGYKRLYFSPQINARENTLDVFFESFLHSDTKSGKDLRNYINILRSHNISDIDLSLFLEWDDIKFYSQIIEIAEDCEDSNISSLATMTVPNMDKFLTMIYSHLGMYAKRQNYSSQDKQFLQKLKSLIKGNNLLSQNLKNPDFASSNTIIFNPEEKLPSSYDKYFSAGLIHSSSVKIKAYNPNEPVYIKDKNGKIYELSFHPDRKCDWNNRISYIKNKFAYIPFLKSHGISDTEIDKLCDYCDYSSVQNCKQKPCTVNMQPLQVGRKVEDCFLEI